MYLNEQWDAGTDHYINTYTDTSYTGENTRCFVFRVPSGTQNSYSAQVACNDYPDNNGVTINLKRYMNGEEIDNRSTHYSCDSTIDPDYRFYRTETFSTGYDNYYDIKTNFPIFKYDPNDQESVDAVKRYVESGDISGAENYLELAYPDVYININLVNDKLPNATITSRLVNNDYSEQAGFTPDLFTITYSTGASGNSNPRTLKIGQSVTLQFAAECMSALLSRHYIIRFAVDCVKPREEDLPNFGTQYVRADISRTAAGSAVMESTSNNGKVHLSLSFNDDSNNDDTSGDDSDNTTPGTTPTVPDVGNTNTLTTTYKLTETQLKSLGNYLWSASFTDDINLVNESPIQNVLSCKMVPVNIGGDSSTVKIVNVDSHVNAIKCSKQAHIIERVGYIAKITPKIWKGVDYTAMNLYDKNGIMPTWLDYDNTSLSLYLPYIGHKTLNTRQFMGKGLRVDYVFDVITGQCEALIYYVVGNEIVLTHRFGGSAGVNICLTAKDNSEYILGQTNNVLAGLGNLLSGNIGAGISSFVGSVGKHYKQESTGVPNALCSTLAPTNVYLIIERPRAFVPGNFGHTHGFNCCYNQTIKNLKGYTEIKEIDLSNINCFESEREAIKNILASGFYA